MTQPLPVALPLKKLIGPSFILLALGFGSGEVILWPYLASNVGLGIAWGALLGITFQFFINMEIERYALIKGESVFVGLKKIWPFSPWWFIASTFLGFGLPGIVAASAQVFAQVIGLTDFKWLAILFLLIIGVLISSGRTVYGLMERITKTIIFIGLPFIIILAIIVSRSTDWLALAQGLVGQGQGYNWLPEGLSLATFLAAFAYAGAGGNLNLTQSIYIREKGYGMGYYAQKISGLFHNKSPQPTIKLTGQDFDLTEGNLKNFKTWWRRINLEHFLVFWFLGFLGICLLMILSYSTTYNLAGNLQGIKFILNEGRIIGQLISPIVGTIFLLVISIMLWQTQLGVLDSTSRIMAENLALKKLNNQNQFPLGKIYYNFLWAQIIFGIILFLFNIYEPKTLIIIGAVINAVAMFIHVGLVNWMNHKLLPKILRPKMWRQLIIIIIFLFFGLFSAITLWSNLSNWLK
ncbi:Nramp family divalent metal transporter [Patescibacteria group bacterium]|nr:Nramp family divalent metal transporter [Patescibacteria group bacterium]